ncbi:MAG TPA: 4-hydroxy-3-methylbut-2-enyl diphosphate reductase [Syntrophales bacterium]|nr:4-hydroxy-3-methylbut-2-enyl diphosphate reductase [Syntrophales bacterium]
MSVKLAETAGFCPGVKRAVDRVLDVALSQGRGKIYTYGPLIHNPQTVELLKKRGIAPVANIDDIPPGEEAILVIRAHGISPEERRKIKQRGLKIVDATCPKVARVQAIIKKYVARGYTIIIVGDKGHPEIIGLLGYAAGRGIVVGSREDAVNLPVADKVGIVAQTTQREDLYDEIIKIIKAKMPQAIVFDTICDSTEKRQKELKDLASQMDAMVIVGGANSANTRRLAEISEGQGTPTFYIETSEELKDLPLGRYKRIGVSAGASTPNWIIDRVVNNITSFQAGGEKNSKSLFNFWLFLVRTDIYSAFGAGCLYVACALIQNLDLQLNNFLTASFYVYAMHVLNRFTDNKTSIIGSFREETYLKREPLFIFLAVAALISSLILAFAQGLISFLLLWAISLLGVLYNIPLLPAGWRYRSVRDLPGSKNLSMSLAWAMVTAVLPAAGAGFHLNAGTAVAFSFTFAIVFIRSVMSDILDMQNDRLVGRETIPVILGRKTSEKIVKIIWGFLFLLLAFAFPAGWSASVSIALLFCLFYVLICFKLCDRRAALSGMQLWGLLEANYIIAGAIALLWALLRALL